MKRIFQCIGAILLVVLFSNCAGHRTLRPDSIVVVKEIDLPKSASRIAQFATHTYIDYRENVNAPWHRVEVKTPKSGVVMAQLKSGAVNEKKRWGERVRILSQTDGVNNPNVFRDIRLFAKGYDDSVYRSYPGPNSNTFIEKLARDVDGVNVILDHNAIGKEVGFHVGKTSGGTGLEVQTPIVGAAVGVKEGVEVSALGLSAGISIWTPSIRIPFLPRIPTWE